MVQIPFTHEGVGYKVGLEAYVDDLAIQLPNDGPILVVDSWFETMPPTPHQMHIVTTAPETILATKID